MEKHTFQDSVTETLGGSEVQRGLKLGTVAGLLALFILFGSGALQQGSSTVNLDTGQVAPLILALAAGLLALFISMILAFYSGLSAPEAKAGDVGTTGLLSGALTMLLFWVAQTIYTLVADARSPQGVQLGDFLKTVIVRAFAFFIFGGLFGWWGARAAARRSRSILSPPSSITLSALSEVAARSAAAPASTIQPASKAAEPAEPTQAEASEAIVHGEAPEEQTFPES